MALTISELSSLNFRTDWKSAVNTDLDYRQKFLPGDRISFQFTADSTTYLSLSFFLVSLEDGVSVAIKPLVLATDPSGAKTAQWTLPDSYTSGAWEVQIRSGDDILARSSFCIVAQFPGSVLLSYANYRNDFGTIFNDLFNFRVEGVFLPNEVSFEVSTEDFRDQRYNLTQLSALPYEKKTLTVGLADGVPSWVGRKLNMIFSCSYVSVDGTPYVRSEGSTPKMTLLQQDSPLFIYKIDVEESESTVPEPDPGHITVDPSSINFDKDGNPVSDVTIIPNPVLFDKQAGSQNVMVYGGEIGAFSRPEVSWATTGLYPAENRVKVDVQENTAAADRTTSFLLRIDGVMFEVAIIQNGTSENAISVTPDSLTFNENEN